MTIELFLKALLFISILTGLITEAIKKQLDELKKFYYTNLLAGIVAVVTSVLVCFAYIIIKNMVFDKIVLIYILALALMSWLCAMVGYDKVIQSIQQMITKADDNNEKNNK